jgi:hypothetical protein
LIDAEKAESLGYKVSPDFLAQLKATPQTSE